MLDNFSTYQLSLLLISLVFVVGSILIFPNKPRLAIFIIFLASGSLGFFISSLDPFLALWDEQFHALVAKNMVNHPLKPMLYSDPILSYNYTIWVANHVWLHKQPLFLWQIALSIKLFGANELAVRIPSIIMHALMPIMIYRIGKIAISEKVGFIGALLIAVAYFPLEQVVGRYSTDHNDVAFLFYVTASFTAWFEYQRSKNWKWLILIGVFSGCAVLTKWLMGLLVFVCWGIAKFVSDKETRWKIKSYLPFLSSLIIAVITFLPWQIYIHLKFPLEASHESKMASEHLFEAVENHSEGSWFHFTEGLNTIYGSGALMPFTLLLGVILLIWKSKTLQYKLLIASGIIIVYGVYTFAATKMIAYPIVISPFIFLGLAAIIHFILAFISRKISKRWIVKSIEISILFIILFAIFDLSRIQENHTHTDLIYDGWENPKLKEMRTIEQLKSELDGHNWVVFTQSEGLCEHVPIMFYTDFIAYSHIPSEADIQTILSKNKRIAIINPPEQFKNDPRVRAINVPEP